MAKADTVPEATDWTEGGRTARRQARAAGRRTVPTTAGRATAARTTEPSTTAAPEGRRRWVKRVLEWWIAEVSSLGPPVGLR